MRRLPGYCLPLILLSLGACSPTAQDVGDEYSAPVSGRAVDGYIANATVYVDTNQNGILDPWEPRALTDKEGFFGYNSKGSGEDYCALPADDDHAIYCLRLPPATDNMMIQIVHGYDTTTGEPFDGQLTSWASRDDDLALPGKNTASPISSLLAYMTPAYRLEYIALEGLTADEMKSDFLVNLAIVSDETTESKRRHRSKLAMQIEKTKEIIAPYIETLFKDSDGSSALFGNHSDFPTDAGPFVLKAMAETLMANTTPASVTTILNDQTALWKQIVAVRDLVNVEVKKHSDLQQETTLSVDTPQVIATHAKTFNDFVTALFANAGSGAILDGGGIPVGDDGDFEGRLRAVEVVTSLLRDPSKSNQAVLDVAAERAMDLALGVGSANAADANTYLLGLSSSQADIRRLVEHFQANGAAVAAADADFSARQTMEQQMGGGALGTDTVNLNLTSSHAQQNTAAMVFNPDGSMVAAISYSDPNNPANNISPDQPLAGSWEQINDYTMLAHLEVGGEIRPMIIRTDSAGNGYLFDFGGEIVEWTPN